MSGCKDCVHDHWAGGDRVCDLRPHDAATPQQLAIVRWLGRPFAEPHTDPGCPSFEDYRPARQGTRP